MRIKETEQVKEFRPKADVNGPTSRVIDKTMFTYKDVIDGQPVKVKVMPPSRRKASYFTRKRY